MSLVLDALNKADSENKQGVLSNANTSRINELKRSNTRKILFIGAGNGVIIAILIFFIVAKSDREKTLVGELLKVDGKKLVAKTMPVKTIIANQKTVKPKETHPVKPVKMIHSKKQQPENTPSTKAKIRRKYLKAPDGFVLKLNGTYIDEQEAFLLYKDEMYKAGDIIDDIITVVSVKKKSVKIQYKGHIYAIPN